MKSNLWKVEFDINLFDLNYVEQPHLPLAQLFLLLTLSLLLITITLILVIFVIIDKISSSSEIVSLL